MMTRCALAVFAAFLLAGAGPLTGTAPGGGLWAVQMPPHWNGTLVVYSHGGAPKAGGSIVLAPTGAAPILLEHGYALGGTTYVDSGWNPAGGARTQFAAIPAMRAALPAPPTHIINMGTSYGGLVGAMEVSLNRTDIQGAVLTCGLLVGGIDLMNAQLDGLHAINQLLVPAHTIELVRLGSRAAAGASSAALLRAVAAARQTPAGRARLALAAALMHIPGWHGGARPAATDWNAAAAQQADWMMGGIGPPGGLFGFLQGSRFDIETAAGGNPSWNRGVDYATLLQTIEFRPLVVAMYKQAGLDLQADLHQLTAAANIIADPAALASMQQSSVPSTRLSVPVLAMQTSGDPVAPRAFLPTYAARAASSHTLPLLRLAMVDRPGHCSFKPGEILAAVQTLTDRLGGGNWNATTPASLNAIGGAEAAFVPPPTVALVVHRPATIGRPSPRQRSEAVKRDERL